MFQWHTLSTIPGVVCCIQKIIKMLNIKGFDCCIQKITRVLNILVYLTTQGNNNATHHFLMNFTSYLHTHCYPTLVYEHDRDKNEILRVYILNVNATV
ncbi:hypothetical protein C5167_006596 [Papaver somniferum]|uniref:Uncharacterized protein n=1 Tax=Papaver somniferum TaxID=3469 RepID=A0A4Y7JHL8_PAPSO|nr:hypothetical protein C5167_006596 [Papaver somniferum]